MKRSTLNLITTSAFFATASVTLAASFTANDLAVIRLGDATHPASAANTALPVYIDEYATSGPNAGGLVQSIGPLTTITSNPASTGTGFSIGSTTDHNATLNLTTNGQYLVFGGYNVPAGGSDPAAATAAAAPRVIARIDANGNVNTSTVLTDAFSSEQLRSVASADGSTFYLGGKGSTGTTGGLRLANLGATSSTSLDPHYASPVPSGTIGTYTDTRDVVITPSPIQTNDGSAPRLFTPSGSSGNGFYGVGYFKANGLPTSAVPEVPFPGATGPTTAASSMQLLDLSTSIPGPDTLIVTEDNELAKYSLVLSGGTYSWAENGSVSFSNKGEKLYATPDGSGEDIYYSTQSGSQDIYKVTDTGGYDTPFSFASLPGTPFISAPANEAFRGFSFTATPEPTTTILFSLPCLAAISRRRRKAVTLVN